MADPFVAEIRMFPFNFAPKGWAWCDGQLLPLIQNTALFALLGTTYGGDGKSNFALPDLQGRVPMHPSYGHDLPVHALGEAGGSETVTLIPAQMPNHTHSINANRLGATQAEPEGGVWTEVARTSSPPYGSAVGPDASPVAMSPAALELAGASAPHNNMQPYLTVNFCIALQGVFPSRP